MLQYHGIPLTLTLAQTDPTPAPPPGNGQAREGAPGAPGDPALPPADQPPPNPWVFPLVVLVMVVLFFLLISMPQRRERKRKAEMLAALKKNDKVQTIGGVLGTVVDLRDHEVVLKVDESTNTRMRFSRSAIHSVLPEGKPVEE